MLNIKYWYIPNQAAFDQAETALQDKEKCGDGNNCIWMR